MALHLSPEYLAGFFDGDGHIGISKGPGRRYRVVATLVNTNVEIMQTIRDQFKVVIHVIKTKNSKWSTAYQLMLFGPQAIDFISFIYPYLRIKKSQADLAFHFHNNKLDLRGLARWSLTDKVKDEMEFRENCKINMQMAKHPSIYGNT